MGILKSSAMTIRKLRPVLQSRAWGRGGAAGTTSLEIEATWGVARSIPVRGEGATQSRPAATRATCREGKQPHPGGMVGEATGSIPVPLKVSRTKEKPATWAGLLLVLREALQSDQGFVVPEGSNISAPLLKVNMRVNDAVGSHIDDVVPSKRLNPSRFIRASP